MAALYLVPFTVRQQQGWLEAWHPWQQASASPAPLEGAAGSLQPRTPHSEGSCPQGGASLLALR